MKYLTTLEVARSVGVSKQTLLNWLSEGKVPEPPRNRNAYRLWSPSRLELLRKRIADGQLRTRTVMHREASSQKDAVALFAREVVQFLRDGEVDVDSFLKELSRLHPEVRRRLKASRRPAGQP